MKRDLQNACLQEPMIANHCLVGHWAASLGLDGKTCSGWLFKRPSVDLLRVPLQDGLVVETVGIPASHGGRDRLTVCVSSQVCSCVFDELFKQMLWGEDALAGPRRCTWRPSCSGNHMQGPHKPTHMHG